MHQKMEKMVTREGRLRLQSFGGASLHFTFTSRHVTTTGIHVRPSIILWLFWHYIEGLQLYYTCRLLTLTVVNFLVVMICLELKLEKKVSQSVVGVEYIHNTIHGNVKSA